MDLPLQNTYVELIQQVAVTTPQHLRDKAPLIRKSGRWLPKKAIRSYQCRGMINTKDGKGGTGLCLGMRSGGERRKTLQRENESSHFQSGAVFPQVDLYFFLCHIFLLKTVKKFPYTTSMEIIFLQETSGIQHQLFNFPFPVRE